MPRGPVDDDGSWVPGQARSGTPFQSLEGRLLARRERLQWFRRAIRPSSLRIRRFNGSARWVSHNVRAT
jgi:hypothetical protein